MLATMPPRRRTGAKSPEAFITLSVRLPVPVHSALAAIADRERRSLGAEVLYIVEQYLAEHAPETA